MALPFLHEHFLLENKPGQILYHEYAKDQPIIDYHCHLPPDEIANDRRFENLTKIWLYGDHYKWRAMRTLGIPEKYVTGKASDEEKFEKWAETVPFTIRNPLYHWTHLELRRYFDIETLLKPETSEDIYKACNQKLNSPEYSTRNLLQKMNVKVVCTTDDPVDDLHFHQQVKQEGFEIKMYPTFRPDNAILIEKEGFLEYIQKLGDASDMEINSFDGLLEALQNRVNYFHLKGCRLSDHGLSQVFAENYTHSEIDSILKKRLEGKTLSINEIKQFQSAILQHLGKMYHEKNWVMQLHLGALRSNNSRMLRLLGPDTGYDSIGDFEQAVSLSRFLDSLDKNDQLPKTILYNLNPRDNEVLATMAGNFNDG